MTRFGQILRRARGHESRLSFSRRLELSYTFVRSMEDGSRFPSDFVLETIAQRLNLDPDDLLLAAYCDRSPALATALRGRGIAMPVDSSELPVAPGSDSDTSVPPAKNVGYHDAVGE